MSILIYPVFRDPDFRTPHKPSTTVEFLSRKSETLDELAEANNLVPFTAFMDNREIPDDFDGDPDELEELLGPCDDWYDPQEAVTALERLAGLLTTNKEAASELESPEVVADELRDLAAAIRPAVERRIGLRLDCSS